MGERAAYKVKDDNTDWCESNIWLRKQWYAGDSEADVEGWIMEIAQELMSSRTTDEQAEINGGGHALRHDLSGGRLANAMIQALSSRPFDQVRSEKPGDVSNHGIFEIEIADWNHWVIWHIPVEWKSREVRGEDEPAEEERYDQRKRIAEVSFESGETLEAGTDFNWLLDEKTVREFRHEG